MNPSSRTIRVAIGPTLVPPGESQRPPREASQGQGPPSSQAIPPLVDIHEGPDGMVLEADLPGASAESLTVQLEENVLSLQARAESPAAPGLRTIHEEFRLGEFQRSFILSDDVDRERISAELKNGVLRLTLPKAERAKTRRIEIKTS